MIRLIVLFLLCYPVIANSTTIVMGSTNNLYGSQLTTNSYSATGSSGGYGAFNYIYTLTRSGDFTSTGIQITLDGNVWNFGLFYQIPIPYGAHSFSIYGVIPPGTGCGLSETIVMKIIDPATNQLKQTTTFIITNPIQAIPVSNFKIFGSIASSPTIIDGCQCVSKNILLNNLKLQYTGTGIVWKYRISIREVTASGSPVSGGNSYSPAWPATSNGPVPPFITLNTILTGGAIAGIVPAYWGYYLITLETSGGPCSGGSGIHKALIHLSPGPCLK